MCLRLPARRRSPVTLCRTTRGAAKALAAQPADGMEAAVAAPPAARLPCRRRFMEWWLHSAFQRLPVRLAVQVRFKGASVAGSSLIGQCSTGRWCCCRRRCVRAHAAAFLHRHTGRRVHADNHAHLLSATRLAAAHAGPCACQPSVGPGARGAGPVVHGVWGRAAGFWPMVCGPVVGWMPDARGRRGDGARANNRASPPAASTCSALCTPPRRASRPPAPSRRPTRAFPSSKSATRAWGGRWRAAASPLASSTSRRPPAAATIPLCSGWVGGCAVVGGQAACAAHACALLPRVWVEIESVKGQAVLRCVVHSARHTPLGR